MSDLPVACFEAVQAENPIVMMGHGQETTDGGQSPFESRVGLTDSGLAPIIDEGSFED